jgi:hypothetical protein
MPAVLWVILTVVKVFTPIVGEELYWKLTIAVFVFYLGSWSSEFLVSKLANIYEEMIEEEEKIPENVKNQLLSLLSVKRGRKVGEKG